MHPLGIRDFRLLVLNRFFLTFGAQMQEVIVGWQIYQITHDPLSLGLIGFAEAAAFIGTALWAGLIADRSEKRRIILVAQTLALACSLGLLVLTLGGNLKTLPIYGVIALSGFARAFLWSSTTSFSEQIVPKEIYSKAAAWNSTSWQIASITGPAAGGILYAVAGPAVAYAAAAGSVLIALGWAAQLGKRPPIQIHRDEGVLEGLIKGIQFVFSYEVIFAALALDMFAVLFGGAVAILPIFAEMLQVGPRGLGFLRAAPGIGAIAMAFYQSQRPSFRNTGRTLLTVVTLFGLSMIAFALSKNFYLSLALLAFSGMVDNVSVIIRASILQAATPNHMRGRVSSVNGIFIGSSNEIGAFESGVAAKLMGTVPSVVFGGVMTLVTVAWTAWKAPRLRHLRNILEVQPPIDSYADTYHT
jgi:MFS family permease